MIEDEVCLHGHHAWCAFCKKQHSLGYEQSLFSDCNRFLDIGPKGVVLADTGGERGRPLLVSQDHGLGRVLAFAGDSTWHWWMRGYETAHKRFWRQVVLWLAHKEQTGEGKVWVKVENRQVAPGDRVEFSAGASDKGELS